MLHIYTDGSFRQPNVGAYGYVVLSNDRIIDKHVKVELNTTINKMELTAILMAVKSRKEIDITIYSDSQYCVFALTSWIYVWRRNNWLTKADKPVANKELFLELLKAISCKRVRFVWIKAHNGDTHNEMVDTMVQNATSNYIEQLNKLKNKHINGSDEGYKHTYGTKITNRFDLTFSDTQLKQLCDAILESKKNRRSN